MYASLHFKNPCKPQHCIIFLSFFLSADAFEFSHQADFKLYFASLPMEHNQKPGKIVWKAQNASLNNQE